MDGKNANMCTVYHYKVVREYVDNTRGKREKSLMLFEPDLAVGGLYVHLGSGFPGLQRVLSMTEERLPD